MVKYIICGLLISGYSFSYSQDWSFNQFYSNYKNSGSEFHISLGWPVLKMASWFIRDEPEKTLIKSVNKIKVIVFEERPTRLHEDLEALVNGLQRDHYEEWLTVRESGDEVRIFVSESEDLVKDFIILADEKDECVVVSIRGKVDRAALKALFNKINETRDDSS